MDYPLMASDVDKFLTARGLASAMVIGHSMGGKTAMQLALHFPHRVEKLVVADMAPRAYAPTHDEIFAALLALDLSKFQTRGQIEDALAPDIPNQVLRRFLLKNLGRAPDSGFFWKINLQDIAENYWRLREPVGGNAPFTNLYCSSVAANRIMCGQRTNRSFTNGFRRRKSRPSRTPAIGFTLTSQRNF